MDLETDRTLAIEAIDIVCGDRPDHYDTPENNFKRIARFWNAWLKGRHGDNFPDVDSVDVAAMCIGIKLGREAFKPTRDNKVDVVGYILTLDRVEREQLAELERLAEEADL